MSATSGATIAVLTAAWLLTAGPSTQTIERHYTPADRERDRYVYIPFDVPAGTAELRVRYAYNRADGQNTVDLGIFEPGSLELGTRAMRGYSGGSKSEVTIRECDATPGYRPGNIPAGRWHVMLGLYQVAASGVDVTVSVETTHVNPCTEGGIARAVLGAPPPARIPRWWPGALHLHTVHSDGALRPLEVLERVRAAGLAFAAITDHNNTTHTSEVRVPRQWPLWIVGEEVTTPAGHANVWGLAPGEWIDFRVRPQDRRVGELVDTAHGYGALFSINHPVAECAGCSWEHELPANLDAIEVWNGRYGAQDRAIAVWERQLQAGRRITAVGASDWHRDPDPIDNANVRVYAPGLTEGAILDGIRAGRVIIMRAARDETPIFTVRSANRTAAVGETLMVDSAPASIEVVAPGLAGGRVVVVANGQRLEPVPLGAKATARVERVLAPGYVRVEIFDAGGAMVALTNPVFLVGQ